jgi:hypothetical protein
MRPTTFSAALLAFLVALAFPGVAHAGSWSWPVRGEVITGYRNGEDPYAAGQHRGIDIAAPAGATVVAAAPGTVTFAGVAGSSGLTVSVRTADGPFDTSYLHLGDAAVEEGDRVREGDELGSVGTSGRRSAERPHLHFGVRDAGERHAYRNPMDFLPSPPPSGEPREPAPAPAPSGAPADPRGAPAPAEPAPAPAAHGSPAPSPAAQPSPAPATHRSPRRAPLPRFGALPMAGPEAAAADPFTRAAGSSAWAPRAPRHSVAGDLKPAEGALHLDRPSPARLSPLRGAGPAAASRAGSPQLPAAGTAAQPAPAHDRATARSGGGIDAAWLAACAGLLVAASALGRSATKPPARRPRGAGPRLDPRHAPAAGPRSGFSGG